MSETAGQPQAALTDCEEKISPCCEHFARCNAGHGLQCVIEKVLVA
jgi:hypothetical protein